MTAALPLSGIRVLDFTRLLPGPFCTQLLADFGADVLKIEDTVVGDATRLMPPFVGGSHAAAFLALNRNKRSFAVNLKSDDGRNLAAQLAATADVVIEGFRPGVMARLGLDFETLRSQNPRLVYCALTGYGQDGPWASKAGHDLNYMALAGALELGTAGSADPVVPGLQVADLSGALYATIGILLALLGRERSGAGQFVDIAMHDAVVSLLGMSAAADLAGERQRRGCGLLSGALPNYTIYRTSCGRHMAVGALEPKFVMVLCMAVERPDLINDLSLGMAVPTGHAFDQAAAALTELFASRSFEDWTALFADLDGCVTPVLSVEEALVSAHAQARELLVNFTHPVAGEHAYVAPVPKLGATPGTLRTGAPALGQHTTDVLTELGLDAERIAALHANGSVLTGS